MTTSYGDIPLSDYTKIVRSQRPGYWVKLLKVLGVACACMALTAAGDFSGIWTGKHSQHLSIEQAMRIVEDRTAPDWQSEIGVGALYGHLEKAIALLFDAGKRDDRVGLYASCYLFNVSRVSIAHIKQLAILGAHPARQTTSVDELRNQLGSK